MLTQKELKYYSSLLQKKYRQRERKFIVEGKRSVEESLRSKYKCELVILSESFSLKDNSFAASFSESTRVEIISDNDFRRLTDTKAPQGIIAVLSMLSYSTEINNDNNLIVAIEDISDPGNAGTIIRTCDWFGVRNIIVSPDSVDLFNPKVIRSTMGSLFHINVYESDDFYSDLIKLKESGREILCSDMNGDNIFTHSSKESVVLILSNEAHGPTENVVKLSDKIITIPKYGEAESLNVASAAAIMIAQLTK